MTQPNQDHEGLPVDEIEEAVELHNRDETTKREAFEQELVAQDRSDEGEEVGDHIE
jgi:hypothetical protein